ncbi:MAG TPA: PIG-L family deacetylase [Candidatus Saccharimonadales bacterium]|nr:PIG-L family deacetylase [Candidatus Saccharimonadales bacterium]
MSKKSNASIVLAIAAHPDDIEFMAAGTLWLLAEAGCEIHYLNMASGNCGTTQYDSNTARKVRAAEARRAAKLLGAHFHPSLTNDLEIFYDLKNLRRLAAVIREVRPAIVLTHSPQDYMEDHTNACRLAVTSAFARGMPNFKTLPFRKAQAGEAALYHWMPHGFRDGLRRRIVPGAFVNTNSAQPIKRAALAEHRSQQSWLDTSQGMNSYVAAMEGMSLEMGKMSGKFRHAEGWRRHLHWGFSAQDSDPLAALLEKNYLVNASYERGLED